MSKLADTEDSGFAQTSSEMDNESSDRLCQQGVSTDTTTRASTKAPKHVSWATDHTDHPEWSEQSWDSSWYGTDHAQAWQSQPWDSVADWYEDDGYQYSHAVLAAPPEMSALEQDMPALALANQAESFSAYQEYTCC